MRIISPIPMTSHLRMSRRPLASEVFSDTAMITNPNRMHVEIIPRTWLVTILEVPCRIPTVLACIFQLKLVQPARTPTETMKEVLFAEY